MWQYLNVVKMVCGVLNRAGVPKALRDYAGSTERHWDDPVAEVLAGAIETLARD